MTEKGLDPSAKLLSIYQCRVARLADALSL